MAGVYCHQSPMVSIKERPTRSVRTVTCELADLLILHSHRRSDGKLFWRGVLMQAKPHRARIVPEEPQLCLYEEWPRFVITATDFERLARDFNRDPRSGLYGLVSSNEWCVLPASNPLVPNSIGSADLSSFLVNMLYDMDPDQPGRASDHGRQVYQNSQYDWSPTIWELVEITTSLALRHKGNVRGLYDRDMSRLGGGVLQMMLETTRAHVPSPPGGRGEFETEEGERRGIACWYSRRVRVALQEPTDGPLAPHPDEGRLRAAVRQRKARSVADVRVPEPSAPHRGRWRSFRDSRSDDKAGQQHEARSQGSLERAMRQSLLMACLCRQPTRA